MPTSDSAGIGGRVRHMGVDPAVDILPAEDQEVTLLAVLPGLTQLQHLVLSDFVGELPVESYAAITASSQLTYLDLIGCEIDPSAAWQIFSPGRCSNLAELKVAPPLLSSSGSYDMLVRCCPALQHLKVGHVLSIGDYGQTDEEVGYTHFVMRTTPFHSKIVTACSASAACTKVQVAIC